MSYYYKGDIGVGVGKVDGFGKRPALWILNKNVHIKVASFRSEESARKYECYLKYMMGLTYESPVENTEVSE